MSQPAIRYNTEREMERERDRHTERARARERGRDMVVWLIEISKIAKMCNGPVNFLLTKVWICSSHDRMGKQLPFNA